LNDVTSVTDPLGVTTTKTYDGNGNLLTTSTPLTGTSQVAMQTNTYGDAAHPGDVTWTADAAGGVSTFSYDKFGDLASSTDPAGNTTTYSYDGIGRQLAKETPRGNGPGADPAGFRTCTTLAASADPMGRTTSHGYDADNERTSTSYSDGVTPDVTFGYNAHGQRTAMTDGTGHSSYTYDSLHRMTSTTNGAGAVVRYAYDLRNLLT